MTVRKNELITISNNEIAGENFESVNARELHKKLGSKQDFANWVKNRINKYGFQQGVDYDKIVEPSLSQMQQPIEYILTLDTAKEIAMVENNEKGREIRRYFIEMEKQLRNQQLEAPKVQRGINTQEQFLNAMVDGIKYTQGLEEDNITMSNKLSELSEQVKALKANNNKYKELQINIAKLGTQELNITIEQFAKKLGTSRPALFSLLRYNHYLTLKNLPYKAYLNKLFVVKPANYMRGAKITSYKQTLVTPKGVQFLTSLINQNALV